MKTPTMPIASGSSPHLNPRSLSAALLTARRFLDYNGPTTAKWIYFGLIASALVSVTELASAFGIQLLLAQIGISAGEVPLPSFLRGYVPNLVETIGLLSCATIFKGLLQYISGLSNTMSFEFLNYRLRSLAVHDMLLSDDQKFISASDMSLRISEVGPRGARFVNILAFTCNNLVLTLFLLMYTFAIAPKLAIVGIFGFLLIGIFVTALGVKVKKIASTVPREQLRLVNGIQRIANNWLLVKILRSQEREYRNLINHATNYSKKYVHSGSITLLLNAIPSVLGIFLLMVIVLCNRFFWPSENGVFLTFFYLFYRFIGSVTATSTMAGNLAQLWPHFRISYDYFHSISERSRNEGVALPDSINLRDWKNETNFAQFDAKTKSSRHESDIKLRNAPEIKVVDLGFRYSADSKMVLQGLNFSVKPGEQLGLIGRSGCGKSTLLNLILGIAEPTEGTVTIDSMRASDFFKQPIDIGYVGPEPFLIKGSIKDNLAYGSHSVLSPDDYVACLKSAHIYDEVMAKPGQMEFEINENGDGFSAGQKQRLSLARSLINNPKILLLDEATSNLDPETESLVADTLFKLRGKTTVIIISHRKGVLINVDALIDLGQP
jgi:ABC-type multidrug transport system fused ATPase/permease subunit